MSSPFENITPNKALRLKAGTHSLTVITTVEEIAATGKTPQEFVADVLSGAAMPRCTVEYFKPNGSSYKKEGQFTYEASPLTPTTPTQNMKSGIPLSGPYEGVVYAGHDALLAKQFEKWYNEETDKNRNLRIELDQTLRDLNKTRNDLELIEMRKDLELSRKEVEQERAVKNGLGGFMDTLEKNSFLQSLLEKVVDNFTSKDKGGNVPQVDDPEIQQAITEAMNVLVRLAGSDREHFGYISLILDRLFADKANAQYIYQWLNTPQPDLSSAVG